MKIVGMGFPDSSGNQVSYKSCGWPCFENAARYQISRGGTVGQWGSGHTFHGMVLGSESSYIALKIQAESFVIAERVEDAARTYEKIGMWKEAGDLRRRTRQSQVVTQVHVNMNDLIDQLRKMGLSANYTCPACAARTLLQERCLQTNSADVSIAGQSYLRPTSSRPSPRSSATGEAHAWFSSRGFLE